MCFRGFAREMCHENKYTIPKRQFEQMDNVNTLHNRYIQRGDNQDFYIPAHEIIDPISILLIITYHRVCQQQKSIRKTPDVIFHLIANKRVCQRTVAQVRIRGSAHESCDRGSVLANSCSII